MSGRRRPRLFRPPGSFFLDRRVLADNAACGARNLLGDQAEALRPSSTRRGNRPGSSGRFSAEERAIERRR